MDSQEHEKTPSDKGEVKKRNPNWTEREIMLLCSFVGEQHQSLFGNEGHCTQTVEERKKKTWMLCTERLATTVGTQRKWQEVKKKWADLKVRANKYLAKKNLTGGGSFSIHPAFEAVLEAQCKQATQGIFGIEIEAGLSSSQETDNESEKATCLLKSMSNQSGKPMSRPLTTTITTTTTTTAPKRVTSTSHRTNRKHQLFSPYEEECLRLKKERIEIDKKRIALLEREARAAEEIKEILEKHFGSEY